MKFIFSWKKKFTREIFFLLEDKLHMFAPSCNILYMFVVRCCSYVKVHIVFFVTVGEPIRFTDLYNYIRPQRIFVNALSTLMHFRLETHPFFMRFRLPPTQIQSKTKVSGKDFWKRSPRWRFLIADVRHLNVDGWKQRFSETLRHAHLSLLHTSDACARKENFVFLCLLCDCAYVLSLRTWRFPTQAQSQEQDKHKKSTSKAKFSFFLRMRLRLRS